jgi:hypothetical protein
VSKKFFGKLVDGADERIRRGEDIAGRHARDDACDLLSHPVTVISDLDVLYERVEHNRIRNRRDVVDERDTLVNRSNTPVGLMAMTVRERATEARHTDDVGVLGREAQELPAVPANQERDTILYRTRSEREGVVAVDVVALKGDDFTREQPTEDLDDLAEPTDPRNRRWEVAALHRPLDGSVTGT